MNWNSIYKGILSIFILVPLIYAQNEDSFVLKSTEDISVLKDIKDLKTLEITDREITQEDVNILRDLNSLESLILNRVNCKDGIELDFGPLENILSYSTEYLGYYYTYETYFISNCLRREGITEDGDYVYIYNANRNQCIHSNGKNGAVTYGDCNDKPENVLWEVVRSRIYYAANTNCCFGGDFISCGEICVYGSRPPYRSLEYYISNKHINPAPSGSTHRSDFGPTNSCLGSKSKHSNEFQWKECDDYDPDQIWEFISYNSTTGFIPPQIEEESSVEEYVYIYNADRNECLTTSGIFGTPITYGKCDNSDNTVWITSNSNSHIRSKANPIYCIRPNNVNSEGDVILGKCSPVSHENQFNRSGNLIKHDTVTGYTNTCIGSSKEDPSKTALILCNEKDPSQIWYFNKWDPSVVVKETAIVYFYNAYKNECIHTDGSSVTMGSCDFNDDSLWEVPNSHKGYYRSKANPEKCLSVVDDKVSLTECNDDTRLYLDGNFIRSSSSKDHCIASSKSDNTLEYIEGCDINNTDHIWYANIWESPETE